MRRGEVYGVDLRPIVGSEMSSVERRDRPCVIVQRTVPPHIEDRTPITIVVPLSDAKGKSEDLFHPFVARGLGGTVKDSRAHCRHVRAIDKSRVHEKWGDLPPSIMAKIDSALRVLLEIPDAPSP